MALTDAQRDEVRALHVKRRLGRRAILRVLHARGIKASERDVRKEVERANVGPATAHPLRWQGPQLEHLVKHRLGNCCPTHGANPPSTAKLMVEVNRIGRARSLRAVRDMLAVLAKGDLLTRAELQADFTIAQCSSITGLDAKTIYALVERKELRATRRDRVPGVSEGVLVVTTAVMRRWLLGNLERCDRRNITQEWWGHLGRLLAGEYGITETDEREARRARAKERAK